MRVYEPPLGADVAVVEWVGEAIRSGEKVLYELAPDEDGEEVTSLLAQAGVPGAGRDERGQFELLDAAGLRAECGGRLGDLYELHVGRLRQARGAGWNGLALTVNGATLRYASDTHPGAVVHERVVDELVTRFGVRALCRYSTREERGFLDAMLASHHRDIDDVIWDAVVDDGRLRVRGELDASNTERFAQVVHAAVRAGLAVLDLSALRFCAVAAVRALVSVADVLERRDEQLVLVNADPGVARTLTLLGADQHPAVWLVEEETQG
jgi:anti-anti-sigma factor